MVIGGDVEIPHVLLSFDFGEKRIGLALGNSLTQTAQPLLILIYKNKDELFCKIEKIILEWRPHALIVGLPSYPHGEPHEMTAKARRFANQLHGRFSLPVHLVDERYTSVSVPGGDDALAAQLILEQFFLERSIGESKRNT